MLTLDTPVTLGAHQYTRIVGGIKGEWDLRTRRIEVTLALAREQGGKTIIATREKDGDKRRILAPPILATLTLQDSEPADPALAGVWIKLHELVEAIEAVLVVNGSLQGQVYQAGEEEMSLAATFVAGEAGEIVEKIKVQADKNEGEKA
jgi:hypothetical protein